MSKPIKLLENEKNRDRLSLILRCLVVFIIPVVAGLMFFKAREIHPYGENSILSVDLWGQYFPMYRQFAETFSFSEAMYSWDGALGFNNFVQSAFYCRSLWLLLFKLVPISDSIIFINYVSLIRLGLSAVTCLFFLEYKFKQCSPLLMSASVCYGLCAYAMAFIMQFMWSDLIVYAPLVLLGLEWMMDKKSPFLYVAMLALSIYTNFYVGFGVCLFTLFYFTAEMVKRIETAPGKRLPLVISNGIYLRNTSLKFALYSALGGCVNAVIAIPTLMGLSNSISASSKKLDFSEWYHTLAENVSAMLPQSPVSLAYGVANIATGLFMFVLVPLYFLNSSVKFREKIASGAFLALLYCGLNYNPLDYVFNGFHFANQLPGRWSFLFSFAVVIIAANGIARLDGVKLRNIFSACIVGVFFIFFAEYAGFSKLKLEQKNSWILWLVIFSALLAFYVISELLVKKWKKAAETPQPQSGDETADKEAEAAALAKLLSRQKVFRVCSFVTSFVLAIVMVTEVVTNAVDVASEIEGGVNTSNMTTYINVTEFFTKYAKEVDSGEDEFYRTEVNQGWSFNDGLLAGYKGIGYYGSTMNGNVFKLLRSMGNRVYAQNVSSVYNNSSVVQNSIFGVRYLIDRGKNLDQRLPGAVLSQEYADGKVWENPTALPLAFSVSENLRRVATSEEVRPITFQNYLVNRMYGEDIHVYEKLTAASFEYTNAKLNESPNWDTNHFYREDHAKPVTFTYVYVCPNAEPVYMEQNFRAGKVVVSVNGKDTELKLGAERFKMVGSYPAGTEIRITAEVPDVNIGCFGVDMYSFNTAKWQKVYDRLNTSGLEVTSFKTTEVTGTMNMAQTGIVFTSIPQDGGWTVYVDGEEVEDFLLIDSLIGFKLGAGTHEITFKYHVPGYVLGLTLTIFFLLVTAFCLYCHKKGSVRAAIAPILPQKVECVEAPQEKTESADDTKDSKN